MKKGYIFPAVLGLAFIGFQQETKAQQNLKWPFSIKKTDQSAQSLENILNKMKKREELSSREKQDFDQALKQIQEKIKKAGGKQTTLSSLEAGIYNQNLINQVSPTIEEILESGLNYAWGMDLALIEERGGKLRASIGGGGADLSSVVTSYQKLKEDAETKKKKYTQEKEEANKKIIQITEETKRKLEALNPIDTPERSSEKQKILEEEKAALEPLQKIILDQTKNLKGVTDALEKAVTNIMAISKLSREQVEGLPSWSVWKEMKAHPETIPQKIQPSVLSRSRRAVPHQPPQRAIPQKPDEAQETTAPRRPLPSLPNSGPPSRRPPPIPSQLG